ncbi:hypothetical protein [Mycolicibacterium septicum]|uniref:hypothetical protein n=1 Tax=Mycolicibacterium septicum TaxID=98668 RepID=UPI001AFC5F5F|nr:hypothetical protein [Mycolicibacterium septicum]QRY51772.1 hypothetical protein JVX95_31100 [Mycolicibacterium septicum]
MDNVDVAIEFGNGRVTVSFSVPEDAISDLEACLSDETVDQIIDAIEARIG